MSRRAPTVVLSLAHEMEEGIEVVSVHAAAVEMADHAVTAILDPLDGIDGFAAWLDTQEPGSAVGVACNPHACPLARYLAATVADSRPFVAHYGYTLHDAGRDTPLRDLPDWAERFLGTVDMLAEDVDEPISAEYARAMLDEIR